MPCIPTGPAPAKVMIVGECPSINDERKGEPFTGESGELLTKLLEAAELNRSQCFMTNVIRERPPNNDLDYFIAPTKSKVTSSMIEVRGKMVMPIVKQGMDTLAKEIALVQPQVIIALGNVALWALTGAWGIGSWRGSRLNLSLDAQPPLSYTPSVIPTYHPIQMLRMHQWRQIAIHDLTKAAKEGSATKDMPIIRPNYNFIIRPSYTQAIKKLDELLFIADQHSPTDLFKLASDIETRAGHIACGGLAWSKTDAICIPLMCVERPEGYWSKDEEAEVMFRMYSILTHKNVIVIGQNYSYDSQYYYRHYHFISANIRDTMLAHHVCFPGLEKALDFQSSLYSEDHVYWKDEGKEWDATKVNEDQLWEYNCKDCVKTYEVDTVEQANVDAYNLRGPHDFQQSLIHPVLESMNRGVKVDQKLRSKLAMELHEEMAKHEQEISYILGHSLNTNSPLQMRKLLYDDCLMRVIVNPKTKKPTTNAAALTTIAQREPLLRPLVRKIAEARSLGVYFSTFVEAPLDIDQRMRCSYGIAGTETFRFSSKKNAFGTGANLQNMSAGGEVEDALPGEEVLTLPNVKQMFVPDQGMEFFDIDLSSADFRVVVWEADDLELKQMLAAGLDPYTELAKEYFHDNTISKKHPARQKFKIVGHATNYLGKAPVIARGTGLLVHEVDKLQKWYFGKHPGIKNWQNRIIDQLNRTKTVTNAFGYRRVYFERIEGNLYNQAIAWIPQSTIGILINHGYRNIYKNLREVQVLLQVHDSLAGQYPIHLRDWAQKRIMEETRIVIPYDDPLIIPVGIKTSMKSWGDCS